MERLEKLLRERCPEMELRVNEPMSKHTTFRIGGPAEVIALPRTPGEVKAVLDACRREKARYFVLGKGSNLLVGDRGIPGVTIAMENLSAVTVEGETVTAQAGASLMAVCAAARSAGLTGLEFAYGIPGQAGGGVYMNAGAYGGELKDVLFMATGALMSTTAVQQGESIPGIAHLVWLSNTER